MPEHQPAGKLMSRKAFVCLIKNRPGPNFIEPPKQKILLNNFLLSRNEQDASHKLYMWHGSLAGIPALVSIICCAELLFVLWAALWNWALVLYQKVKIWSLDWEFWKSHIGTRSSGQFNSSTDIMRIKSFILLYSKVFIVIEWIMCPSNFDPMDGLLHSS